MIVTYCVGCQRYPDEIQEYVDLAREFEYSSAKEAVRNEEGTLNDSNGHFWCTECYIRVGMPAGSAP